MFSVIPRRLRAGLLAHSFLLPALPLGICPAKAQQAQSVQTLPPVTVSPPQKPAVRPGRPDGCRAAIRVTVLPNQIVALYDGQAFSHGLTIAVKAGGNASRSTDGRSLGRLAFDAEARSAEHQREPPEPHAAADTCQR
ncbi:hypothetical protein MTX26_35240 (plasmid) [Bradyrhizobium sp. ISRA443]|uniref:hypothetical protein n=1 Tax=unclassified Bradyrhizobium TaxID=2631580 RepID=UPI002479C5AB|nr:MULTISPECIES: hypothetical protein [unclassified Bradyrhizobium]WGR90704.1 hypothetical protein MTX20_01105 [Bradyrhizobium sp. ISRA435]WGS03178.1 hypothetical protein MTX23_35380 [Bradyrhizobium sp. ISRA436]WGS10028.1 hypothetical protein MTX18_35240 [Bradyrhizobium sp. ISRA437]WGS16913.1 hypothetical protein MTX26_35240 [Bradyrhizobium sp. ISRA443]